MTMWISLLFCVFSISIDVFRVKAEGDVTVNDEGLQMLDDNKNLYLPNILNENKENYINLKAYIKEGLTEKGQTFHVYDDGMRNATIALFRILLELRHNDKTKFDNLLEWAEDNINSDMLDYAKRLVSLFSPENINEKYMPPFIAKPNYFVNGETILKAFYVKRNIDKISVDVMKMYQIHKLENNVIAIDSNYSQWNGPFNACDGEIKYFTEDVALNSYYYGLHLLHLFWMSNGELSELNPRHAEHYYFAHQQLYARYLLEKEHFDLKFKSLENMCELEYNPYLYYENGLPFPTRSSLIGQNIRRDLAYLKTIDTAIRECIHRGMVVMENGTYIKITEENYIDVLAKLIRANFDGIKATKVIRLLFGYGNNGYPTDKYNPSPSVLNHPQTTLREPVYWFLIRTSLNYFSEYENRTQPLNISAYESDDFVISEVNISRITTSFQYFFINLYMSLSSDKSKSTSPPFIFARQRRLYHHPFTMNFTVVSKSQMNVVIRLYLGPQCSVDKCNEIYFKFFQLDCYRYRLNEGINSVIWAPEASSKYSDLAWNSSIDYDTEQSYNIFKFPENLVLPKGLEHGLNLTLFVMVISDEESDVTSDSRLYNKITREVDNKPLGFPMHRKVNHFSDSAPNYRFYNISIFHDRTFPEKTSYFSSYLY